MQNLQTLTCWAPRFIAARPEVLRLAPAEMAASGYADLIAKNPAGGDWVPADALGQDPIVPEIWSLIQGNLSSWIDNPGGLAAGRELIKDLN